ncbi:hypothetical protein D0Z08_04555 [Nocardioides immobilis]|uniref:Uncharacterized protein n=1 Tax=Nocardioides immobilis TaxID=2049295 RepID=A0A417Y6Q2_9ACTN|nr:hypothetical protein [Nocardioides immobilis]RHW28257.1 hypothetical protein D0Z08_04555 [Nocardioides immobilis]
MSHRTQITLEDEQYARLLAEGSRSGLGLAELVRRAVDVVYPSPASIKVKIEALDAGFGAWSEEEGEDRAAYLKGLRPDLGDRLAEA